MKEDKQHCEKCDQEYDRYCKVIDKLNENNEFISNVMSVADMILDSNHKKLDFNNHEELTGALVNALALLSSRNQILILELNK